ncbi:MarR family transcriptional regulator [Bradyrhizobium sp. 31Argb]|uniref:MarR family transcriptional regulator n=1 Tax=Bradyrhizobium sp. 31Argb TaxID=3141247 RepID=UPI003748D153
MLACSKQAPSSDRETDALTQLILEVLRLNGSLIAAGDRLVADLTRSMGLHRQGVQRIVNELVEEGIVTLDDNPHHRCAKLVRMSKKGEALYRAAERRRKPSARRLAKGIGGGRLSQRMRCSTRCGTDWKIDTCRVRAYSSNVSSSNRLT